MSYGEVAIGDRWGHVECLGIELKQVIDEKAGVQWDSATVYVLKCDCGAEFDVPKMWFKGKRRVKDCGCGLAASDGAVVLFTVSVPMETRTAVKQYASRHGLSVSRALVEMVRKAVVAIGQEQSRKENSNGGH